MLFRKLLLLPRDRNNDDDDDDDNNNKIKIIALVTTVVTTFDYANYDYDDGAKVNKLGRIDYDTRKIR